MKNTPSIVTGTWHHQNQFCATPLVTTQPASVSGVSAAKVVATMEVPSSHQGVEPPEVKYSRTLLRPRRLQATPIANDRTMKPTMIHQSRGAS